MVGEIRDTETAKIAVRASITGHIVLSTIHTNNSLNTIERLLDMDVERYLLASALTGIVSQKLARKLYPKCKQKKKTNEYEKQLFKKVLHKDVEEIYQTEGCEECGNGYSGRIAIHEVLLVNQEIKDAISSNMKKEQLRNLVYSSDVTTLLQDGLEKVVQGETTVEEVLKLIELDNDDPRESKYDLKEALRFTKISQESQNTSVVEEKIEPTPVKAIVEEPKEETKVEEKIEIKEEPVKSDIEFEMPVFPKEEPKEETKVEEKIEIKEEQKKEEHKVEEPKFDDEFEEDLMNMEF